APVRDAGARLGGIARARGGAADRGARGERVRGAITRLPVALLSRVARARSGAADRGALQVRRALDPTARAGLRRVADAGRGTADCADRRELVLRAGIRHPVAPLGDIARAQGGPALRAALQVGRALAGGAGA